MVKAAVEWAARHLDLLDDVAVYSALVAAVIWIATHTIKIERRQFTQRKK